MVAHLFSTTMVVHLLGLRICWKTSATMVVQNKRNHGCAKQVQPCLGKPCAHAVGKSLGRGALHTHARCLRGPHCIPFFFTPVEAVDITTFYHGTLITISLPLI